MATPKRVQKPMPSKGLRTAWPSDAIGQEYASRALNVRFRFGEVIPTPGRGLFDRGPVAQQVNAIGQFPLADDSVWAWMLLQSKLYRRGNTAPGNPQTWNEVIGTLVPTGTRRWSWTVGEDRMFFCRGEDAIMTWDGVAANQFDLVSNVAGFEGIGGGVLAPSAKYLTYHKDRLYALHTIEGGTTRANRIRWTESGDFRKWDETAAQGAGFLDLSSERMEPITGAAPLGDRIAVYRRRGISDIISTGVLSAGQPTHVEEVRVHGNGLLAPYSLVSTGFSHFFLGYDKNIWMWNGVQMRSVGDPIYDELQALVHNDKVESYFGFLAAQRQEYWFVICDPDNSIFEVFVYDFLRNAWSRDSFSNLTAGAEVEDTTNAILWNQLVGTWEQQGGEWNAYGGLQTTLLLGGRTDGATMRIDEQFSFDYFTQGSIIDKFLETEDMYLDSPWELATVVRVLLNYQFVNDEPIEVGVSFDRGITWNKQMVIPSSTGYSFVDFRATGNVMRFRFRENNADGRFRYRSYFCEYEPAGPFIGTTTA